MFLEEKFWVFVPRPNNRLDIYAKNSVIKTKCLIGHSLVNIGHRMHNVQRNFPYSLN